MGSKDGDIVIADEVDDLLRLGDVGRWASSVKGDAELDRGVPEQCLVGNLAEVGELLGDGVVDGCDVVERVRLKMRAPLSTEAFRSAYAVGLDHVW